MAGGPKRSHGHQVITAVGIATAAAIVAAGAASYHAAHGNPLVPDRHGTVVSFVPNHNLHPGAANPAVTQATIATNICVSGWTATVRPMTSYTDKLKAQQMAAEHMKGSVRDYEEDHLISLELGGNPADPKNLWPEPWQSRGKRIAPKGDGAEAKDVVETRLNREVCNGTRNLKDAQTLIANWKPGDIVH